MKFKDKTHEGIRIVLPKELRSVLEIKEGDLKEIFVEDEKFILCKHC
ncbi:AbrB/MazE/SpoVT family DNA-binding domain-containing protein [Bacillus altitudinis]